MYKLLAILTVLLGATTVHAAEDVILTNGFRIRADRHEAHDSRVLIYARGGVTDLPAEAVERFETIEAPPSAAVQDQAATAIEPRADAAPREPRELLRDAASRSGLPPTFVESVAKVESGFRPEAVSPKGAVGVMQLMPETARALNADAADMEQNIEGGVRLLRELLIRYDGDVVKALAAYNAGTAAVSRYGGLPPYPETRNYVDKVLRTYINNGGR